MTIPTESNLTTLFVPAQSLAVRELMMKTADLTDRANDRGYPGFAFHRIQALALSIIATVFSVCNALAYAFEAPVVFVQTSLNPDADKSACVSLINAVKSLAAAVLGIVYTLGGTLLPYSYNCFRTFCPVTAQTDKERLENELGEVQTKIGMLEAELEVVVQERSQLKDNLALAREEVSCLKAEEEGARSVASQERARFPFSKKVCNLFS